VKKLRPLISVILASSLIAGCTVGPKYHKPAVQTPTEYRDLRESPQVQEQAASYATLPWWQVFQDPQLQELIRTALKQNYDLQLATERINAERAQLAITRSDQFPQAQGSGTFSGGKEQNFQTRFNFLSLAVDAAFQLDFFGRYRRATEAARAQLLASEEARHTVTLTLVSDVASAYFALLQLDLELQITQDTVKTQEDSVRLTSLRLNRGVATRLDVLQSQQVLDTANARIPDLERQIAQEEDAISILIGDYPQGVQRGRPLPEQALPPDVPPGLPSTLLERRPDIRQAEQVLIAANAEIGVAKALFFPECPCRCLQLCLRRPFNPWPNMWTCIPTPLYQFAPLPHNPLLKYLATFHHAQKLSAERPTETDIIVNSTFRKPCSLAFLTPAPRNVRTLAQRNSTTRHAERQGPTR